MSRFTVKRSLKQLYIEKHAVEYLIAKKKCDMTINGYEPNIREVEDLLSEELFLKEILNNIYFAEEIANRNDTYK